MFPFFTFPYLSHQKRGGKPSISGQVVIVMRLTVQRDGPFGNKIKSCLINGDINHGLAQLAKRCFIPCLIYGQDMREGRKLK